MEPKRKRRKTLNKDDEPTKEEMKVVKLDKEEQKNLLDVSNWKGKWNIVL
jgi:hypothetical protein